MNTKVTSLATKVKSTLEKRKVLRDIAQEFFNHVAGYLAGLLTYNYLIEYFEVRGVKNLWGVANFRKKVIVDKDTFENMEFIISAIVGFIIFKIASYYSAKLWDRFEREQERKRREEEEVLV